MNDPFFSLYDIAYHYDAMSILEVKYCQNESKTVAASLARFDDVLRENVGAGKHILILGSDEYARMLEVNRWLFKAFDWLHTEGLKADPREVARRAIETDRVNGVDRPAAKRALQERWFPEQPLTEQKMGYSDGETTT